MESLTAEVTLLLKAKIGVHQSAPGILLSYAQGAAKGSYRNI